MTKRKFFSILSISLLLSGIIGYNYMYKNHRNISEEQVVFTTISNSLIKEYNSNIAVATAKYLDKTIQLNGKVTEVEKDNFMLDNVIVCYTDSITITQIANNKMITVKGRNIGYDGLLDFIKLDQVTIINN